MRRLSTLTVAVIAALAILAAPMAAMAGRGGSILTMQGNTIPVSQYLNLVDEYAFVYQDQSQTVPMQDIVTLTRTDAGVLLVTRDGKSLTVTGTLGVALGPELSFKTTNPVTGASEKSGIDPVLIKTITLD